MRIGNGSASVAVVEWTSIWSLLARRQCRTKATTRIMPRHAQPYRPMPPNSPGRSSRRGIIEYAAYRRRARPARARGGPQEPLRLAVAPGHAGRRARLHAVRNRASGGCRSAHVSTARRRRRDHHAGRRKRSASHPPTELRPRTTHRACHDGVGRVDSLQRCRYRGADGVARAVGLGVIASNLLSIAAHADRRARAA